MGSLDQLRERIVAQLGDGYARGLMGFDTLCHRVNTVYAAGSGEQLVALARDLPGSSVSTLRGVWRRASSLVRDKSASSAPALLAPPVSERTSRYLLGRDADCDLHIDVATVSRRHAALQRTGEKWTIEDLGSFNGTRLNGWRVDAPATVVPGDAVELADLTWIFAPRLWPRGDLPQPWTLRGTWRPAVTPDATE